VTQGAVLASIVSSAAPFLSATCRHRSIMKSSNLQANVASIFSTSSLPEISRISDGDAGSGATGSDNIAVNWGHKDQCIRVSARPNSSGWGA
jgi:hypothetical protein